MNLMIQKTFSPYQEHGLDGEVRLLVYDIASENYIIKDVINSRESYQANIDSSYLKKNLKFRYQIISDGKWQDAFGGNRSLFGVNSRDLLKLINFIDNVDYDISVLEFASEAELAFALKHMINKVYEYLFKAPNIPRARKTLKYLKLYNENLLLSSNLISHFHSQLSILVGYIYYRESNTNVTHTHSSDMVAVDKLIADYDFINLNKETIQSGVLVAKGSILTVHDRDLAYECYQKALKIFNKYSYMESFLSIDALTTYYPKVIETNETYSIEEHIDNKYNDRLNVCFSTDPKYFRMFGYIWANASLSFKGLNFNFGIVTETKEEYIKIVSEYQSILMSLSAFMGLSYPTNNRFYWIDSTIVNRTVYACARFYLSKLLLEKYPSDVYLSDIDQMVVGDLYSYLIKINEQNLKYDVYLPMNPNYYKLLVGRSHMAGNIYIRNNHKGKEFAELLCDYVGKGLGEYSSWMLDQNATRYASETVPTEELSNLGQRILKQYPAFKVALRSQ